jgi:hypothetical protein
LSGRSDGVGLLVVNEAGGGWAVCDKLGHSLGNPRGIGCSLLRISNLYSCLSHRAYKIRCTHAGRNDGSTGGRNILVALGTGSSSKNCGGDCWSEMHFKFGNFFSARDWVRLEVQEGTTRVKELFV